MNKLLLAYYADDFTGATDALECLSRAGVKTALFTQPPTPEMLEQYDGLQAVGIAGCSRSMAPDVMEKELEKAFCVFDELQPRHIHYKVCSTFDSAPEIGNIGRAIEVGRRVFGSGYVPLVVGIPTLGRYCLFGNLFAATHVGNEGQVYRLDRHPTASRHPVTPMRESDLLVHLKKQTELKSALFDVLQYESDSDAQASKLSQLIQGGAEVVLFDAINEKHIDSIGRLIEGERDATKTQYSVGSSAIEYALTRYWATSGELPEDVSANSPTPTSQVLVQSGSCSPVTESQIDWAVRNGFAEVALDTESIASADASSASVEKPIAQIMELLESGKSVVAHASKGNKDPRIASTLRVFEENRADDRTQQQQVSEVLGAAMGRIARRVLAMSQITRVCFAGGDTSGMAARQLSIESISMCSPLSPGAPLCRASAPSSPADGREFVFKGGQVGREDFFGLLLGTSA